MIRAVLPPLRVLLGAGALLLGFGCQGELTADANVATLDEPFFRCRVQPVLTKNCSAFACHGDAKRYFRVYARNRLRLGGNEAERNALLRDTERAFNFASASGFVDQAHADESLLVKKPLDEKAGGYYHGGAELFGKGDVFGSRQDAELEVLANWIRGKKEDAACIEPGSDL